MTEHLDAVDWASLFHAEGSAADTPERLRAMLNGEDKTDLTAWFGGHIHLQQVLPPKGKAWPATAPAALLVTDLLDDPRLDAALGWTLLSHLRNFALAADLGDGEPAMRSRVRRRAPEIDAWTKACLAADAAGRERLWAEDGGLGGLVLDQARLACFDAVPEVLNRVLPHLSGGDVRNRAAAASAVGVLARHPSATARRPTLMVQLASMAGDTSVAESSHAVATILIALGLLGGDTRPWLADPDPGVRGCAALAPGLAGDVAATEVLVQLSRAPRAFGVSFGDRLPPPQALQVRRFSGLLTDALLERVRDPRVLAPAVIALLPLAWPSYRLLTPYLRVIFPDGGAGARLDPAQRLLAKLIAGWDGIWALRKEARAAVFEPAGLGWDRAAWEAMAAPDPLEPGDAVYTPENLFVLEGLAVVRARPKMFVGAGRADAGLLDGAITLLRAQFGHAVATGQIEAFRLETDPAGRRRFTIDVRGDQLSAMPEGFDGVFAGLCPRWPVEYLSVVAALSSRVWVKEWFGGGCRVAEYVDGMAMGSVREDTATPPRDGYEVTFEMEDLWWPLAGEVLA